MRSEEGVLVTPLSTLNSSDIETVEVLKDASATSIYGARAANGVIVITTKRARSGKTRVNFSAKLGMEKMAHVKDSYKTLNASQYVELYAEALLNDYNEYGDYGEAAYYNVGLGLNHPYTMEGMKDLWYGFYDWGFGVPESVTRNSNTNWLNEIKRTGLVQEYNIDLQGGSASETGPRYYLSLNYFSNESFLKGNG